MKILNVKLHSTNVDYPKLDLTIEFDDGTRRIYSDCFLIHLGHEGERESRARRGLIQDLELRFGVGFFRDAIPLHPPEPIRCPKCNDIQIESDGMVVIRSSMHHECSTPACRFQWDNEEASG